MSANADFLRLRDMLDRAERISHYLEGKSRDDLVHDAQLQDAVLHCFLILGEAAAQVTQQTKDRHPQLPWRSMVGIRNHIVHGYTRLDLGIIWETATNDLPSLIVELLKIVPPELT
jgi:uncharacterized protein with HEPN domain